MGKEEPKPGQKYPTPTPGFGDRVFYETLLHQNPKSHMAQEWCLNYGVLPHKQAAKLLHIVTERKKRNGGKVSSPTPKKKKAKIVKDAAVDPELKASGAEGIGVSAL